MELIQGESLYLHLDARPLDVIVPLPLKTRPQLVLQVGLNMPVPIPDLQGDDWGVTATLSFSRQPFTCRIPWAAIYAMVAGDGRGMVWPEDVPDEVATQMGVQKRRATPAAETEQPAAAATPEEPKKAAKPRKRKSRKKAEELPPNVLALKDHPPPSTEPSPAAASPPKKKPLGESKKKKREIPSYLRVVK